MHTGTPAAEPQQRLGSPHIIRPDPTAELRRVEHVLGELHNERKDLDAAKASWWHNAELQPFTKALHAATVERDRAERALASGVLGWRERRRWQTELSEAQHREAVARADYDRAAEPKRDALDTELADAEQRLDELQSLDAARSDWNREHADAAVRLGQIDLELGRLDAPDRVAQRLIRDVVQAIEPPDAPQSVAGIMRVGVRRPFWVPLRGDSPPSGTQFAERVLLKRPIGTCRCSPTGKGRDLDRGESHTAGIDAAERTRPPRGRDRRRPLQSRQLRVARARRGLA